MTESVDTGDLPPKLTADASTDAQDRPRENDGEKQPEKQVLPVHGCKWEHVL